MRAFSANNQLKITTITTTTNNQLNEKPMYEKTNNYLVLTMQRYSKKPTREKLFNESA